jgi:hypothetical protein
MDPLTIPLALGCILTFSQVEHEMTKQHGQMPDGVYYKTVTLTDGQGHKRVIEPADPGSGFSPGAAFEAGRSPDKLFASYVVLEYAARHNAADVRFVSAKTCARVRFVLVRNGTTVSAEKYEGWLKDSPHSVRVWQDGGQYELGLPIDEARSVNPRIQDKE